MESPQLVNARDPVCGMTVSVNQGTPSAVFGKQTFYFCAPGCQATFLEAPEQFVRTPQASRSSPMKQLLREASIVAVVLVLAIVVVAWARGKKETPPAVTSGSSVTGTAAGQDQAVDNGAGSVIASATFDRTGSSTTELVFTLSLNTHTIDLSDFDPVSKVVLRTSDGSWLGAQTAQQIGERSGHHQNYRVTFVRPSDRQVELIVRDVAGVAERRLPFTL